MFSGIVRGVGRVLERSPRSEGVCIKIGEHPLSRQDVFCGACISVSGEATTIEAVDENNCFFVSISAASWSVIASTAVRSVNLELAVRFGQELGGHFVSGHVDGLGTLDRRQEESAGCLSLSFSIPAVLQIFVAQKGSIAINGVSLTVQAVEDSGFAVYIIPYTTQQTNLGQLSVGQNVNVEVDLIARYLVRYCEAMVVHPMSSESAIECEGSAGQ